MNAHECRGWTCRPVPPSTCDPSIQQFINLFDNHSLLSKTNLTDSMLTTPANIYLVPRSQQILVAGAAIVHSSHTGLEN